MIKLIYSSATGIGSVPMSLVRDALPKLYNIVKPYELMLETSLEQNLDFPSNIQTRPVSMEWNKFKMHKQY